MRKGDICEVAFPYLRTVDGMDFGGRQILGWKPGHVYKLDGGGGSYTNCTAMGRLRLEVIHICKMPGRYQDRVFHKKFWIAPDGTVKGGKKLDVSTINQFMKLSADHNVDVCDGNEWVQVAK